MVRRIPEDTLSRDTANLCKDNCFILIRQTIERNLLQLPNLFTVCFKVQHTTYTLSYTFAENKLFKSSVLRQKEKPLHFCYERDREWIILYVNAC